MPIDILHLFPDLAAIGQQPLQSYCNAWLQRAIARQFAIAQITVDDKLMLQINLAAQGPRYSDDQVFIPIDELLGYIVDRHFADPDKRRQLHASIRNVRKQWGELGRRYAVTRGRMGTLYLACKTCGAELETSHRAIERQGVNCPPTDLTCPACAATATYEAGDLIWRADQN